MSEIGFVLIGIGMTVIVICLGLLLQRWLTSHKPGRLASRKPDSQGALKDVRGLSIEHNCLACGRKNRVPRLRLHDRPRCGECKELLRLNTSLTTHGF